MKTNTCTHKIKINMFLNAFVLLQAAVKSKKATDTYKLYVEKYALTKADFEQKMSETAQVGIFKALN